jgi:hypothetical protein
MKKLVIILSLFPFSLNAQIVQINGTGRTVTINAPGKPSSVSITQPSEPPEPDYFDPQSGDITFTDEHFQYSIPGYAGSGYTARSSAGFVEFRTSETSISVKVGGNWSTASSAFDEQSDCEVLVNGVYNQSVRLTVDNTTQTYAISLPVGEKIVRLVNGYTANGNNLLPGNGVFVQGVVTIGNVEIKIPVTPINKKLFIGNSITTGATSTHPTITGFAGLLRNIGWQIQMDSYGGRRLLTTSAALGDDMAEFISDEMNGTITNEVFMFLGTNNFALFGGHSKANFKLYYGYFLDALHTLRSDITIYCISPFNRDTYSTPNSQGATCEDYADAIEELLVTRTWAKFIYGKDAVSLANMVDSPRVHPNQAGHQQISEYIEAQYNLLNP